MRQGLRDRRRATYGDIPGWSTPRAPTGQAAPVGDMPRWSTDGQPVTPWAGSLTSRSVPQPAQAGSQPLSRFLGALPGPVTGPGPQTTGPAPQGGWLGYLSGLLGRT